MLGPLKINATRKRSRGIRGSLKQVLISLVKPGQMRLRMVLFFFSGTDVPVSIGGTEPLADTGPRHELVGRKSGYQEGHRR